MFVSADSPNAAHAARHHDRHRKQPKPLLYQSYHLRGWSDTGGCLARRPSHGAGGMKSHFSSDFAEKLKHPAGENGPAPSSFKASQPLRYFTSSKANSWFRAN